MGFSFEFLKNPIQIGSPFPSSKSLAKLMVDSAKLQSNATIVELGPGTGSVTKQILKQTSSDSLFFAIEINEILYKKFKQNFPDTIIYHGTANEIKKYLKIHNRSQVDCIISAIPWATLSIDLQQELFSEIYDVLAPGGKFLTIALLIGTFFSRGKKFKQLLDSNFELVNKSPVVWKNFPPAIAYICEK
tara:strand:+ start:2427 stop:2993 length:567 start_codon:yes stop_codon:yes gene_type:complete